MVRLDRRLGTAQERASNLGDTSIDVIQTITKDKEKQNSKSEKHKAIYGNLICHWNPRRMRERWGEGPIRLEMNYLKT